ncbi:adenosylcobinamide kinase/adenosylcobinamide-phosphate guanylyltransferase [Streptococcus rupicaprae]|uniref:Adenosylcobinamide kinase n=1 Tax=Streptococcus rupicaprae TaxID=759619 RepID=A0ABV2FFA0_9STRE
MAKLVLVTGGARSGKSAFAEAALWDKPDVCYLATGLSRQDDPDWQERVRLHQQRRPEAWVTHEQYAGLGEWLRGASHRNYLLDCVTMLTTNVLFDTVAAQWPDKITLDETCFLSRTEQAQLLEQLLSEWQSIIASLRDKDGEVYIVTNEIGLGIVPDTPLGRYFRDVLGQVNQFLAKEASEVYLVICGLAQRLK